VATYSAVVCGFTTYTHFVLDAPAFVSPLGAGAGVAFGVAWKFARRCAP
jgi:hypothetical protein